MKRLTSLIRTISAILLVVLVIFSEDANAQRFSGGGGAARPATSRGTSARPAQAARPTHTQPAQAKPAQARPVSKPAQPKQTARPTTSNRPENAASAKGAINGGSQRVTPAPKNESKVASVKNNSSNNKAVNTGDRGSNNKVNVDKSRGDVNINIDNSRNVHNNVNVRNTRNVAYRPPYRPYPRPPYMWGGMGFSCYRPYAYHPYTPYYWGPVWHPWGFLVATLAVTAIIVSVNEQEYHYDEGVFYQQGDGGYVVVEAPQGATVKVIPEGSEEVEVTPTVNNYYYGGTFYEQKDGSYTVVAPPAGSVVTNLPEGAEEVKVGDQTYVKYGDTYYSPVKEDGKDMYEVVQVEEAK